MSVHKFLKRITAQHLNNEVNRKILRKKEVCSTDDAHTNAVISDPHVQFAIVLAAVVHDVGHSGVSNTQLAKEDSSLAARYRDKSLAEQHSFGEDSYLINH